MTGLKNLLPRFPFRGRSSAAKQVCLSAPENFVVDENFVMSSHPPCPACGSDNIAIYVYGKPLLTRDIIAAFESGRIISGGCMIRQQAPKWHCNKCSTDFGHLG